MNSFDSKKIIATSEFFIDKIYKNLPFLYADKLIFSFWRIMSDEILMQLTESSNDSQKYYWLDAETFMTVVYGLVL